MAPSQVKSDYQLVEYAGALLRNFGPQRVATDVPWRIFTATLSTAVDWPTDPVKIMHFLRERSASFVAVDGILFWLNSDVHRDLLAAQILRLPQCIFAVATGNIFWIMCMPNLCFTSYNSCSIPKDLKSNEFIKHEIITQK
uniref:Uncharacterized protein n=1 Tax=Ascaris lumbricoides TaxID=6252 RepID=A0A0M3IF79_ASCLU